MQYLLGQISCFGVAGGDCGVVPQQQVVHGSAHNLAAADHHRSLSSYGHTCRRNGSHVGSNSTDGHFYKRGSGVTCLFDQRQAAVGRARDEAISQVPSRKLSCVYAGQSGDGHGEMMRWRLH